MNNLEEKTISKEVKYKGKILDVELHQVELPDGSTSTREILKHNGAVAILALTKDNEVILVEQYRKAVESNTLEIPAGKLELGEDPLEAAVRELEEETGYKAEKEKFEKIFNLHPAIGYSSELIIIYFVSGLENQGQQDLDDDEFVNCKKYSIEETFKLIADNKITDSKTLSALFWLKNRIGI